jgi:hypothetical protein
MSFVDMWLRLMCDVNMQRACGINAHHDSHVEVSVGDCGVCGDPSADSGWAWSRGRCCSCCFLVQ